MKQTWRSRRWKYALPVGAAATVLIPSIRRQTISRTFLFAIRRLKLMPRISATERAGLEAGDSWVEAELFTGSPDWSKLRDVPPSELTREEQAFLDGPVERLCAMATDWDIWQERDLPEEVWDFIRSQKFLGMIIPSEYGGLGFSASAHSAVIRKLHSRSIPLSITVMVPNSLGPAELLLHYGTQEQKSYYLPRLAAGIDLPCFALTEPEAGSDAASLGSHGEVFRASDGQLYLRLNWNKRWITLAAVATVVGLAFRLHDPANLLGKGEEVGITCALIPRRTEGVRVDRRHDPMGVPFYNSPTEGKDVVVPISAIIGGAEGAGRGWVMLMESLAAGRGISLPAQSASGCAVVSRVAGAHAAVRKQFGLPIGKFEGVSEALAQIGGLSYAVEALRRYTLAALDSGKRPAVVTAIAKYESTELFRKVVNHGMDVLGGAGISLGPRNLLGHLYIAAPISITVEGANILTRSLIVYGQGVLRLHPYIRREIQALDTGDHVEFDRAILGHVGFAVRNFLRASFLGVTRRGSYEAKLNWASAVFATLTEISLMTLGGKLKKKETLSGRFADALSWMYIATASLHRFQSEGARNEDRPLLSWVMDRSFAEIQAAFEEILRNFPVRLVRTFFRNFALPIARLNRIGNVPTDEMDRAVARLLMEPGETRDRIFGGVYLPRNPDEQMQRLESAFKATKSSDMEHATRLRKAAIEVDSFDLNEYRHRKKAA